MEITTNTIAELYIKQGYPEKAMDIYRAILELDPDNATAKEKLGKLEAEMSGEGAPSAVEEASFPDISHSSPATAESPPVANDVHAQIDRLEGWLGTISQAGRRA
ncbi:MAG: tetratricopeptide repeat protein [Deltaproteobacteria bacterium]|nr:tetratricopeptide repeat protein [Deltaproteobacteria bacterium]